MPGSHRRIAAILVVAVVMLSAGYALLHHSRPDADRPPAPPAAGGSEDGLAPNHGQGLRAFAVLGISQQALAGYDDPDLLRLLALDLDAPSDLRNEALNGLRLHEGIRMRDLLVAIAEDGRFGTDYRTYAVQHLALVCRSASAQYPTDESARQALGPYLAVGRPVAMQREAAWGLAEIDATREYALTWLSRQIRDGRGREFGDLYLRACREHDLEPEAEAARRLDAGRG